MQDINSTAAHSSMVAGLSWWNSSGSHFAEPSLSNNLSLKLNSLTEASHQTKKLGHTLQDHEVPLTECTDQSNQEFVSMGKGNSPEHVVSALPENNGSGGKRVHSQEKPVFPLGAPEIIYPAANIDYGQSLACIPCPYTDPCYGGMMSAFGQPAIIHPQMVGMFPSDRVPLPLELTEDGPIYVNAKQYHGILRRRQLRAKLMAQNKHVKNRKPYLHESRHLHAMKRVRGSGGRFLNTKQPQNLEQQAKSTVLVSDSKKKYDSSNNASGSDVTTSSSTNGMFQIIDSLGFPDYHSHAGVQGRLSMTHNSSPPQRVPVIR